MAKRKHTRQRLTLRPAVPSFGYGRERERGVSGRYRTFGWALLTAAVLLTGCGKDVFKTLTEPTVPLPPVAAPPGNSPPVAGAGGSVTIVPQYAAAGGGGAVQFTAAEAGGGSLAWFVNGIAGGNATVGTVNANGGYSAPASVAQSANVVVTAASTTTPLTEYATAVVSLIAPGVVAKTGNPQVASYVMYLPAPGRVAVTFGPSTGGGLTTWQQATPSPNGGQVTLLVAGMLGNTSYHMHAQVALDDGATFTDTDHVFATGTPPVTATVTTMQPGSDTPQPGIELFDTIVPPETTQAFATDLNGNVIWTYSYPEPTEQDGVQPIKLLPNGHFLVQISYASSIAVKGGKPDSGALDEVREVDLAGNTIRTLTQASLAASVLAGYGLQIDSLHHDVLPLPNGHMVLLGSVTKSFNNLPGYPGVTKVQGDALVDVDQNFKPDWVWNTFDHLDVNRHPIFFPDWTHANALLYSSDDHDLLLSLRHQNWILKIDFNDGTGTGNIVWRLGQGGDFQLQGGTDPTDWFYAQHGPGYFSVNTAGTFSLGVMDNGDYRMFPAGVRCGLNGGPVCLYSSALVLQVNEAAKTAQIVEKYVQPGPVTYSYFGGDVQMLANGDLEADFCADKDGSVVQELHGFQGTQQVVWQAMTPGANQYRAERLPSLYPGVQW